MSRLLDVTISPGRPPRGVPLLTASFAGEGPVTAGLPGDVAGRLRSLTRRAGWSGERGQLVRSPGEPPLALFGLGPRAAFDEQALAAWLKRVWPEPPVSSSGG